MTKENCQQLLETVLELLSVCHSSLQPWNLWVWGKKDMVDRTLTTAFQMAYNAIF